MKLSITLLAGTISLALATSVIACDGAPSYGYAPVSHGYISHAPVYQNTYPTHYQPCPTSRIHQTTPPTVISGTSGVVSTPAKVAPPASAPVSSNVLVRSRKQAIEASVQSLAKPTAVPAQSNQSAPNFPTVAAPQVEAASSVSGSSGPVSAPTAAPIVTQETTSENGPANASAAVVAPKVTEVPPTPSVS